MIFFACVVTYMLQLNNANGRFSKYLQLKFSPYFDSSISKIKPPESTDSLISRFCSCYFFPHTKIQYTTPAIVLTPCTIFFLSRLFWALDVFPLRFLDCISLSVVHIISTYTYIDITNDIYTYIYNIYVLYIQTNPARTADYWSKHSSSFRKMGIPQTRILPGWPGGCSCWGIYLSA